MKDKQKSIYDIGSEVYNDRVKIEGLTSAELFIQLGLMLDLTWEYHISKEPTRKRICEELVKKYRITKV